MPEINRSVIIGQNDKIIHIHFPVIFFDNSKTWSQKKMTCNLKDFQLRKMSNGHRLFQVNSLKLQIL